MSNAHEHVFRDLTWLAGSVNEAVPFLKAAGFDKDRLIDRTKSAVGVLLRIADNPGYAETLGLPHEWETDRGDLEIPARWLRSELARFLGDVETFGPTVPEEHQFEYRLFCALNEWLDDDTYPSAPKDGAVYRLASDIVKRDAEKAKSENQEDL